jgi:hypothetical protein
MPRPIHFEVHAADPKRAIRFYEQLAGWKFTKWDGPADYWLITTGPDASPGINGGLVVRRGGPPADGAAVNAHVCTIDIASVDDALRRVTDLGGQIALPKMAVPGVGWLAYAKDTEGNIFGMMQADPAAT